MSVPGQPQTHKNTFDICIRPVPNGKHLSVVIDGEEHAADGFEFSAPKGFGLAVKQITRIELESDLHSER